MRTSWMDEEFRGARITLVALSMIGWPVFLAWDLMARCAAEYCEPARIDGGDLGFGALFVGVVHLGLLISFVTERGGWVTRLIGGVCLLPVFILAAMLTVVLAVSGSRVSFYAPLIPLLLLHAMQLWRLGGFAFPRIRPVLAGGFTSRNDTYAAHGAERNAGR